MYIPYLSFANLGKHLRNTRNEEVNEEVKSQLVEYRFQFPEEVQKEEVQKKEVQKEKVQKEKVQKEEVKEEGVQNGTLYYIPLCICFGILLSIYAVKVKAKS